MKEIFFGSLIVKTFLCGLSGSIADERSRTSTGRSPQAPEACASANSATSAGNG